MTSRVGMFWIQIAAIVLLAACQGNFTPKTLGKNNANGGAAPGAGGLASPNHAMDFGYYYSDGRYGNFNHEVFSFTNLAILFAGAYDSTATWGNPNPTLNIANLFDASLRDAFNNNKSIFLLAGGESEWDLVLNVATPYWSKVKYVELFHEDSRVTTGEATDITNRFIAALQRHGLRRPLLGALESPGAEVASNIDFIGIEAYVPQPFNQDDPGNVQRLNNIIDARKATVQTGKQIVMVMMAYDRNLQWTNIPTLVDLQWPAYYKSYNDPRVSAILMFSYARPGGTRDHQELKSVHQQMGAAIQPASW